MVVSVAIFFDNHSEPLTMFGYYHELGTANTKTIIDYKELPLY